MKPLRCESLTNADQTSGGSFLTLKGVVSMSRKLLLLSTILAAGISSSANAQDSVGSRIEKLEQEIKILKRQSELDKEEAAKSTASAPKVEFGKKGLKFTSNDGDFTMRLRGYAQIDNRTFLNDDNNSDVDEFLVRRARPIIEGEVGGDFAYRIMYDFGGGQSRLFDAYGEYKPDDAFNLRLGKFKVPVGLERLKSRNDINFLEASLPTNLAPNRDIGLMAYGDFIPELSYEVGVFNGIPDLGNENGDEDDNKEFAARLFAHPFKQTDSALKGLGLGVAGTWGEKDGSTSVRQVGDYRTPGQARFFRYATTTFADGEHWRIAPQGYYYAGPFGLLAEYTISNQEVRNGGSADAIENKAWEVQLSYILTGEEKSHKGWPKIANPFNPSGGGWGAWEVAAKYGELDIDDDAFPIFADPSQSAEAAQNVGLALNGYLNDNVKVSLDYEHTTFDGGAAGGGDRETEQVLLSRVGFVF
jgi:phosphate-selective porin OprO/OprP